MKAILLEEIKKVLHAEMKTALGGGYVTSVSIDSREISEGSVFFAIRGQNFDGHAFIDQAVQNGALAVVIDQAIPLSDMVKNRGISVMRVPDTIVALSRLAKFYRRKLIPSVNVIGVTGSNGKTTVREMIYHVLGRYKRGYRSPHNYNNNIGVPLTIFGIDTDCEFAVIEIGTNAPGEIAQLSSIIDMDVAVITHIGASHLEGLVDVKGVSEEKVSIISGLKPRGLVVSTTEYPPALDKLRALDVNLATFGLNENCDIYASDIKRDGGGYEFTSNDRQRIRIPMAGLHNVKNALAALAAARRLGITSQQFAMAIQDFKPVHGRMNYKVVESLTIIDDTYNANPESMNVALDELTSNLDAPRRVFACGDMGELGDKSMHYHQQLGKTIADSNVDLLLTVGPMASETAKAALDAGMGWSKVQRCVSSKRLARLAKSLMLDGDVVLVKGSRSMEMETVVKSLSRWKGKKQRK